MKVKTTISITEARKKFFDLAEEVQKPNNYYTLTENGRPKVVIVAAEEFESMLETLEVMRDFPDLTKDVEEVERAYQSGKWKKFTTLAAILAKEGYVAADKSQRTYVISSSAKAKRRKRVTKH